VYRCEAKSVAGFIQQLAISYLGKGYYFYVAGEIPAHKDPAKTDQKILEQYRIDISKWARARRKKAGQANIQYLRHGRFYVIIATHGKHRFFAAEEKRLKDIRETAIRFEGYSIGVRREWGNRRVHPSVRIERVRYLELKAHFEAIAVHQSVENILQAFACLPFEAYAPVRNQLYMIRRAVNRKRRAAGFEPVPLQGVWRQRKSVKPFETPKYSVNTYT
jgi:hypothetical protein